jgi:hypothetical protein
MLLPAATYLAALFHSARIVQLRYLLPVVLLLALFEARAVRMVASRGRTAAWVAALLVILAAAPGILWGTDLTHAMLHDSRYAAGEWLAARARAGDRSEYFGPTQKLPPLPRGVATARAIVYLGAFRTADTGPQAVREILQGWEQQQPRFVISMPDHSSPAGYPESSTCPPEVLADLLGGKLRYRFAAEFHSPALLPWAHRPELDYPTVNPPIRIFERVAGQAGETP